MFADIIDQAVRNVLRDVPAVLGIHGSRPGAVGGRQGESRSPFERLLPELKMSVAGHRPVVAITLPRQGFWHTSKRPSRNAWLCRSSIASFARLNCGRSTEGTIFNTNLGTCCLYFVFNPESCIRGTTHVSLRRCKFPA